MLERERLAGLTGVQWLGWASVVGVLSLLGAAFISSLINLPLARLTAAARAIAKGKRPAPLPEKGSQEIIEANRSFNQMVDDLQQVEKDRAVILAGISHDLRTPLARMQLELEMAKPVDGRARRHAVRHRPDGRDHRPVPRLRQADRSRQLRAGRDVAPAGRLRPHADAPADMRVTTDIEAGTCTCWATRPTCAA
jgi:signal transduction histidine kinase